MMKELNREFRLRVENANPDEEGEGASAEKELVAKRELERKTRATKKVYKEFKDFLGTFLVDTAPADNEQERSRLAYLLQVRYVSAFIWSISVLNVSFADPVDFVLRERARELRLPLGNGVSSRPLGHQAAHRRRSHRNRPRK